MPKPGEKNAPSFDPEKPEELGRFFDRIEEWFSDDGITGDADRKKRVVRYLDADSEIQWKAFSKFENGTYAEFKDQVMKSYPKAEEVMKGSMTALKRKLKKLGMIATDERDELLGLIRVMTAEVAKLKKITPPIHTNRELVELFLGRLTPDFAARIANKLSVHRLIGEAGQEAKNRNPEDMFDIEEVMEMAKHTSLENANPFGKFLWTSAGAGTESSTKIEEVVAKLTDTINLQAQYTKQVDQKLSTLQSSFSQSRTSPLPAAQPGYGRSLINPGSWQNSQSMICFYCKGKDPHRASDCPHAHTHLDLGWIIKSEGRLCLPDGSRIPRESDKSMREIVDALNKKPGIIPMAKLQGKHVPYQDKAASYSQSWNQEDSEIRLLKDLLQKVGIDRLQSLMNIEDPSTDDKDEWDENFY